jgi:hypothetical protein
LEITMEVGDEFRVDDQQKQLREIAAVLAAGVLRLRSRAALPVAPDAPSGPRSLADSGGNCLEVPDRTVLSDTSGVNGARDPKRNTT